MIVVAAATAALGGIAALLGWFRNEMVAVASIAAIAAALPTVFLAYRQRAERLVAERALQDIAARTGNLVESAMDAIITIDENHRVVLFNAAAEAMFGCPRGEALGAPLDGFIPERFRAGHATHVRRFGETRTVSRRMGSERIVKGLRRNGEEFPIDASISQIEVNGQRLYTVILRDVTERWAAEKALRASRDEIRELALAASSAREEEKARVARELHDELGQSLTALQIDITFLRESLPGAEPRVQEKLAAMQALVDGTVTAARRISSDLRPLMLDDLGLVAACDWLVQNLRQRTGIECELVIGAGDLDLPDPYATAVFRVLQESLTNVAKHAGATHVEITLERGPEGVALTVRDDGRGFPTDGPRKAGTHGLTGLRERASLLEGTVTIESGPGRGTLVEMQIPYRPAPAP
ncbi:hypothetical protein BWI17_21750 [Betaproteobacteria bacterium GR16-43]|nr:hypothetical protein BWI17_21750 [Betaproteobacteria bacterium GR16-43]